MTCRPRSWEFLHFITRINVFFAFKCLFKAHFIEDATDKLAQIFTESGSDSSTAKIPGLNVITDPLVKNLIRVPTITT